MSYFRVISNKELFKDCKSKKTSILTKFIIYIPAYTMYCLALLHQASLYNDAYTTRNNHPA